MSTRWARAHRLCDRHEPFAGLLAVKGWQRTSTKHVWQRRKSPALVDSHAEQLAELIQQARDPELGEHVGIDQQARQIVPTRSNSEVALDRCRERRRR